MIKLCAVKVTYDFDFAKYDQRLAANVFFGLANAEKRDTDWWFGTLFFPPYIGNNNNPN